ncbi:DNA topoisomerase I [Vigna unguiculata]|uniref:DNA topoisomerase I n=1 Tax=Vigna unguiculata TaxID=3917 RepID=A0A4D6MRX5_VIGUN|nr:DNA topoisomerase I [Vigna unguiculata]
MGMSKQDLAKRFKALKSSSQTSLTQPIQANPVVQEAVTLVSDEETTQSGPSFKRRRPVDRAHAVLDDATIVPVRSEHTLFSKGPVPHEGPETKTIQEDAYGFFHRAKVSVVALCGKLDRLTVVDKDRVAELASTRAQLTTAKEEVVRLTAKVEGFQSMKKKMEERGKRVTELEKRVAELEISLQKVESELVEKEQSWRALEEKMTNETASTYGVGFEAALE